MTVGVSSRTGLKLVYQCVAENTVVCPEGYSFPIRGHRLSPSDCIDFGTDWVCPALVVP